MADKKKNSLESDKEETIEEVLSRFKEHAENSGISVKPVAAKGYVLYKDERYSQKTFFEAVEEGDAETVFECLKRGRDPNMRRVGYGDTALHIAASRNARNIIRVLAKEETTDFMALDSKGRSASQIAYMFGGNPALSRYLRLKAEHQKGLT